MISRMIIGANFNNLDIARQVLIHLKDLTSKKTEIDSVSIVLLHFAKRKTNTYLLGYETIL